MMFVTSYCMSMAQTNDLLLVKKKKNKRTIAMFTKGSYIECYTTYNMFVNGVIKKLQHDSVVIYNYTTGLVTTEIGGRYIDTISRRFIVLPIHHIKRVKLNRKRYFLTKYGPSFMLLGGLGNIGLNTTGGYYFNNSFSGQRRLRNFLTSLSTGFIGYLLMSKVRKASFSGKRHKIECLQL